MKVKVVMNLTNGVGSGILKLLKHVFISGLDPVVLSVAKVMRVVFPSLVDSRQEHSLTVVGEVCALDSQASPW